MTHDPHQEAEAMAFALIPQAGPKPKDTTRDMFGLTAEDLQHLTPKLAPAPQTPGLFD
jgi:hypothetical protein